MDWWIDLGKSPIKGKVQVPADKSISHRAAMFSSIAEGSSRVKNFLFAEDCLHTVEALRKLGVSIEVDGPDLCVSGLGLKGFSSPEEEIYLGNSGTTMRVLPGLLVGQEIEVSLTGDASLLKRPMARIVEPLKSMGASIDAEGKGLAPPLRIRSASTGIKGISYESPVASAQVKSCILAAALCADGPTTVEEPYQSRDHTERMLEFLGAEIKRKDLAATVMPGSLTAKDIIVPGDISSAAFFIVAGLILPGSQVYLDDVGINPTRIGMLNVLQRMGAKIVISDIREEMEPMANLQISASSLRGTRVSASEIPALIDEVPILAVAAAFAEGRTVFEGISELKVKECDRISAILENFKKLRIDAREKHGALEINGEAAREIPGAELCSHGDHRMAMSMAVCAMASEDGCNVTDVECVKTSYPDFYDHLTGLTTKKPSRDI